MRLGSNHPRQRVLAQQVRGVHQRIGCLLERPRDLDDERTARRRTRSDVGDQRLVDRALRIVGLALELDRSVRCARKASISSRGPPRCNSPLELHRAQVLPRGVEHQP